MENGYIYTCKKCGKKHSFLLECGMFCFMEEQLFDINRPIGGILEYCNDEEEKRIVRKLVEDGNYHLTDGYGYKICKCDKCGNTEFDVGIISWD